MDRLAMLPAFVRIIWLPCWRLKLHPSFSKARRASRPETIGSSGNRDLDLDSADGQRQTLCRTRLEATDDRLADIDQRFVFGCPLADAPRN